MAQASCKRCKEPVAGEETECPRCGGPVEDDCTICGKRELRGEELRRCIGCGAWLCGRAQCSRDSFENLARRATGRVCAGCFRKREIVPRTGSGKGAGSAAGVEAVERGRYYIYEATVELEERLRALSLELAERISSLVAGHLERVGDRTLAGTRTAAGELGQALEEALARGLSRGTADLGGRLRMPAILIALVLVAANAAVTATVVLALR